MIPSKAGDNISLAPVSIGHTNIGIFTTGLLAMEVKGTHQGDVFS